MMKPTLPFLLCLVLALGIAVRPVVAQDNPPPPTPLPIEQEADALQAAANAAVAQAQAAVLAAQQAATQAAAARAAAATARERANALDAQAALLRATEAERAADEAARSAGVALDAARRALDQAARAVTAQQTARAQHAADLTALHATALQQAVVARSQIDDLTAALEDVTTRLITAEAAAARAVADQTLAQGLIAVLCAVSAGLVLLALFLARSVRPVRVPVTLDPAPSASGVTVDNATADVVPGAFVDLSPEMRQHIDRLLAAS